MMQPITSLPTMNFHQMHQPNIPKFNDIHIQRIVLDMDLERDTLETKGRNSNKPKKSNHGARPCSSYMRKTEAQGMVPQTQRRLRLFNLLN